MFRNFLLADRILRSLNCTPISHPQLPMTANHPLWQSFDLAVETCLYQLMKDGHLSAQQPLGRFEERKSGEILGSPRLKPSSIPIPRAVSVDLPFFSEHLTAFEVWLDNSCTKSDWCSQIDAPEELPVLLQVLLSQAHRVRALKLLNRFLSLGPYAVNLALSVVSVHSQIPSIFKLNIS